MSIVCVSGIVLKATKLILDCVVEMIVEYPTERRIELLPLFENQPYLHALSEAFLKEGLGKAFVDDLDAPKIALLNHKGIIFLAGEPRNVAVTELLGLIPQKALIIIPSGEWEKRIKDFWGAKLKHYPRTKFSSEGLNITHMKEIQQNIPDGMVLEELTSKSIHQISDQAKGIITLLYPSLDKFLESNFGFLIREENTVVSLALAASPLYSNEFEIHIETHPNYQKRGLAMISAARLIEYSLENGMVPHWDADNPPSAKLAMKLGFANPENYNTYFWIEE